MGRANQRTRKGKSHQHLAKVGTSTENDRLHHAEGRAVLANFGLGGHVGWNRAVFYVVLGLLTAGGSGP